MVNIDNTYYNGKLGENIPQKIRIFNVYVIYCKTTM